MIFTFKVEEEKNEKLNHTQKTHIEHEANLFVNQITCTGSVRGNRIQGQDHFDLLLSLHLVFLVFVTLIPTL